LSGARVRAGVRRSDFKIFALIFLRLISYLGVSAILNVGRFIERSCSAAQSSAGRHDVGRALHRADPRDKAGFQYHISLEGFPQIPPQYSVDCACPGSGRASPYPWGTFPSYSLPAFLAHSIVGQTEAAADEIGFAVGRCSEGSAPAAPRRASLRRPASQNGRRSPLAHRCSGH
jgi:hypothetical protein